MTETASHTTDLGPATTEGDRRPLRKVASLVLSLDIPGTPAGQGSMTIKPPSVEGGKDRVWYPDNTIKGRNLVIDLLVQAWRGRPPMLVPVAVGCRFTFPRPGTHYLPPNKSREFPELRDNAPMWHTGARDVDKMQRLIGDALEIAGIVKSDGQIVLWRAEKPYGDTGLTTVEVHSLGPPDVG